MATPRRRTDPPLDQELFDEPYRFDFFQAVRLLERIYPDRRPVGQDGDTAKEVIRFRTHQTLSFPPAEINDISRDHVRDSDPPPEMTVSFMGATGPSGVLPHQYTELLMERARYKDTALWNFLDIFNHRMISLFYRVWEKHRFPIPYERTGSDSFTEYLFSIVGLGTRGLRGRLHLPDQGLLLYGGLIAQEPHSASAIQSLLGDYFAVEARVEQFAGQWLELDDENITRLGAANSELGESTIAGTRVWDTQSDFRLQIGPLNLRKFEAFLPNGSAFKPLTSLARFLAGLEFDFDVQLIMKASDVPECSLGTSTDEGPRLGWTSWLKTKDFVEDDRQVILAVKD